MPADIDLLDVDNLPGDPPEPIPTPTPAPKRANVAPPAEPEPTPKKYAHTPILLREAAKHGYTAEVLSDYPPEAVWEELHRLKELTNPHAITPQPAKPEPPKDPDDETLAEWEAVDPKGAAYLRRQRDAMKALQASLAERDEKLSKIDKLEAAEQQRQARAVDRALDDAFAALPEGYERVVGEGGYGDVDQLQQSARLTIVNAAKIDWTKDGKKAIAQKVAAAALAVAGARVKAAEPQGVYRQAAARQTQAAPVHVRTTPPKDPETGRFTAQDFGNGTVHRPDGKRTGLEGLTLEEGARQIMRKNGDPRGDRPVIEMDDNLPD